MARAKYQVLIIPYLKDNDKILYCIFKRKDMDDCWQFIAGGGEAEDKIPIVAAKREAFEEAGITKESHFTQLDTNCSISTEYFRDARAIWGEQCLVIPEYCFAVELCEKDIVISKEHTNYEWVDYDIAKQRLKYDSNKVALWELHNRIKMGRLEKIC